MGGRGFGVGMTLLALLVGCGPLPAGPALTGHLASVQSRAVRSTAWTITPVEQAPGAVMATLDQEKAEVLREIQKAEHLKSVAMSPETSIREWRVGAHPVGYVVTLHGNVVFDKPNWQKTGAFIVDFCIDPQGNDFGGVYAFTVKSERPISKLRPARSLREGASPLSLAKVTKPAEIQAACQPLYGPQRDTIAAHYPGLRVAPITTFPSAIAVRYQDAVIGYIDSQTSSALPAGDVLGIQVLNYVDVAGKRLFGEARAAKASDANGYRTIRL